MFTLKCFYAQKGKNQNQEYEVERINDWDLLYLDSKEIRIKLNLKDPNSITVNVSMLKIII